MERDMRDSYNRQSNTHKTQRKRYHILRISNISSISNWAEKFRLIGFKSKKITRWC